ARAIDQDVGWPECLHHILRQRLDSGGGANVEVFAPRAGEVCELCRIKIGRDHLRALGAERLTDGAPDPLAAWCYECDLVVGPWGHGTLNDCRGARRLSGRGADMLPPA